MAAKFFQMQSQAVQGGRLFFLSYFSILCNVVKKSSYFKCIYHKFPVNITWNQVVFKNLQIILKNADFPVGSESIWVIK